MLQDAKSLPRGLGMRSPPKAQGFGDAIPNYNPGVWGCDPQLQKGVLLKHRLLVVATLLVSTLLSACNADRPLTVTAEVVRGTITPNGDALLGTTVLRYSLSAPARVNVTVRDASGRGFPLRTDETRPSAGSYELKFDGTRSEGAGRLDRRVLPDGEYRLVVDAVDRSGLQASAAATLRVAGADNNPPRLDPITVAPRFISPNFDAIDDALTATFRLSKEALVSIYAEDPAGAKVDVRLLDEKRPPGEYVESWNGVVNDSPLPDGAYSYVISARDRAGNVSSVSTPVQVAAGGIPRAKILRADFAPRQIILGGIVQVRMRIKNVGDTILRTQGPDPGFAYSSYDSFGSILNGQFIDRAGLWRAGVDWAGAPISGGARYPYRWGFGKDLQPGEEVEISGEIQVLHQITKMWFFGGIIQEGVRIQDDGVGRAQIEVSF